MEAKLQNRVQRYGWDAAAKFYEDGWRSPLSPAQRTLLDLAAFRPGEKVIEAACGSGLVTKAIARAVGPAGEVLATDIAQNMVDLTEANCAADGIRPSRSPDAAAGRWSARVLRGPANGR